MLHQAAGWCFQLEEAPQPAKVINGNTTCKHALLLPQGVEAAIARAQAAALASSPAPSETAAPAALAGAHKPPTPSPVRRQQEAAAAALASPEQRGVSLGNAFARAPPRVMSTPDASEVQPITGQIQPVQRLPQSTAAAAAVAAAGAAPEGEPQSRQQSVAGRLSRFGTRSEHGKAAAAKSDSAAAAAGSGAEPARPGRLVRNLRGRFHSRSTSHPSAAAAGGVVAVAADEGAAAPPEAAVAKAPSGEAVAKAAAALQRASAAETAAQGSGHARQPLPQPQLLRSPGRFRTTTSRHDSSYAPPAGRGSVTEPAAAAASESDWLSSTSDRSGRRSVWEIALARLRS